MRFSRTQRTNQATSSVDKSRRTVTVNFTVPVSWSQLTQEPLRRVFDLLVVHEDMTVVKTILLVEFCGLTVERKTRFGWKCQTTVDGKERIVYLKTWEIQDFIGQLEYISQLEDMDNRLDVVCGLHAADPLIRHGVSFEEYLYAEKYYQKFVETQNMEWLDNVAMWLYRDADGRAAGYGDALDDQGRVVEEMTLTPGERVGTMLWYGHVKRVMANSFPHFFRKTQESDEDPGVVNFIELYNVQLRALTDGDVTKEKEVLRLECWRALTELEAKAREAEELEKIRERK